MIGRWILSTVRRQPSPGSQPKGYSQTAPADSLCRSFLAGRYPWTRSHYCINVNEPLAQRRVPPWLREQSQLKDRCNGQEGNEAEIFQRCGEEGRPSHEEAKSRNAQKWKIRPESQKQETGDCDRAFGSAKERGQGSEKEAIKEMIALQSDEASTAGAETIQSSSSSSGPDSSSLRNCWLLIWRVRDSLRPLAGTDFRFIWLAAPSASALPHGSLSKRPGAWRSS